MTEMDAEPRQLPALSELFTVAQAARLLGLSEASVYVLVGTARLGHHRVGNGRGRIRISRLDIAEYLSSTHRGPETQQPRRVTAALKLKHLRV
jgi:excisionase family DNA binding protein